MRVILSTIKKTLIYDLLLSALYTWCVYQAYIYDAKTQTGGVLIYIVVYGFFTLLSRSVFGVFIMNLMSAVSLNWIFLAPVIYRAGGYFDFQPFLGIVMTIFVGFIQLVVVTPLNFYGKKFLNSRKQYVISFVFAVLFSIAIAWYVSMVPVLR